MTLSFDVTGARSLLGLWKDVMTSSHPSARLRTLLIATWSCLSSCLDHPCNMLLVLSWPSQGWRFTFLSRRTLATSTTAQNRRSIMFHLDLGTPIDGIARSNMTQVTLQPHREWNIEFGHLEYLHKENQ